MKYLILLLMVFIMPCDASYTYPVDHILKSYLKEIKCKRKYEVLGVGGSMPNRVVHTVCLSLIGNQKVNLKQARFLYIEAVEDLVKRINQDNFVRPYLIKHPIDYNNIEIQLSFKEYYITKKDIVFVSCINGKIYYRYYNNEKEKYIVIYEELYEEALKIVQAMLSA